MKKVAKMNLHKASLMRAFHAGPLMLPAASGCSCDGFRPTRLRTKISSLPSRMPSLEPHKHTRQGLCCHGTREACQ
jgi:hypothetical protein